MSDTAVIQKQVMSESVNLTSTETKSSAKKTKGTGSMAKTSSNTKGTGSKISLKKTTSNVHPKYIQMINEAIAALKDRNGSSRQAILKYIIANFKVLSDEKKVNTHIKMSLRAGVKSGKLRQSKGSGACGSYKLGEKVSEKSPKTKSTKSTSKKVSLTKVKKPTERSNVKNSSSKKVSSNKSSSKPTPKKAKSSSSQKTMSKSARTLKQKKTAKSTKGSKNTIKSEKMSKRASASQSSAK